MIIYTQMAGEYTTEVQAYRHEGPIVAGLPQIDDIINLTFQLGASDGIYTSPGPLPVALTCLYYLLWPFLKVGKYGLRSQRIKDTLSQWLGTYGLIATRISSSPLCERVK